jgi:hypothetical protein
VIDPFEGHHVVELAPFVDFDIAYGFQAVLVTVLDMHIVYNRAKGFNIETSEYQDKVTIAKEENEINSELLATMDMGNPIFTINDFVVAGKTLHIELCETVDKEAGADYVVLSIGLDFGMCPTRTSVEPSPSPTQNPIPATTSTNGPSLSPTVVPTSIPTSAPKVFVPPLPQGLSSYYPVGNPDFVIIDSSVESSEQSGSTPLEEDTLPGPFGEIQVAKNKPDKLEEGSTIPTTESFNSGETVRARIRSQPDNVVLAVLMSSIAALSTCCAYAAYMCYQRRSEEQKRNLRILQFDEGSRHVKVYMKNPL